MKQILLKPLTYELPLKTAPKLRQIAYETDLNKKNETESNKERQTNN